MTQGPDGNQQWPRYPGHPSQQPPPTRSGPQFVNPDPPGSIQDPPPVPARPYPAYTTPSKTNGRAVALLVAVCALLGVLLVGGALWASTTGPVPQPAPPAPAAPAPPPPPAEPLPAEPRSGEPLGDDLTQLLDARYGTFEAVRFTGNDDRTLTVPAEAGIMWARSDGGWFSVKEVRPDGTDAPLYYTGDAQDATVPFGLEGEVTSFTVEARDTNWEVEFRPISAAPPLTDEASGRSHAVLIHDGPERPVEVSYEGESNFIVAQHGEQTRHHVNEIGTTTQNFTLAEGPSVIELQAWQNGEWTIRND